MIVGKLTLVQTLPCLADPGKIIVVAVPDRSLAEVIPYLATLPSVLVYNPRTLSLTMRRQPGLIVIQPDRVSITQAFDEAEGGRLLEALTAAINATWDHRQELVPASTMRRAPRPLEVWALLPQSNCKVCGQATCMAFAVALLEGRQPLSACLPLMTGEAFAGQRSTLESLVQ